MSTVSLTKSQLVEALRLVFNKTGGLVFNIEGDVDIRLVGDPRERRDILTDKNKLVIKWTTRAPQKKDKEE